MNRRMAAKHAKAKKMAMQEVMENQNDFSETRWGLTDSMRKMFHRPAYDVTTTYKRNKSVSLCKTGLRFSDSNVSYC